LITGFEPNAFEQLKEVVHLYVVTYSSLKPSLYNSHSILSEESLEGKVGIVFNQGSSFNSKYFTAASFKAVNPSFEGPFCPQNTQVAFLVDRDSIRLRILSYCGEKSSGRILSFDYGLQT
jgi:hypothetical protein